MEEEITERTYTEMAEEYKNVSSSEPGEIIKIYERHVDIIREPTPISDNVFDNEGEIIVISRHRTNRMGS